MTYFDLGPYSRKISTSSPEAQLWFDRGLNWLFGFNHAEAIKCFQRALKQDPECAMAHWGVSYASGPNYNLPWTRYDPKGRQMALSASYDAMQEALARSDKATPVEQAMIRALPARYPQREAIEDMAPWDKAYTKEMRKVFAAFTDDLEVRAVFAESIMNETPWLMWDLTHSSAALGPLRLVQGTSLVGASTTDIILDAFAANHRRPTPHSPPRQLSSQPTSGPLPSHRS